ncbi:MAG TPA: FGGY family carbohydrate kinase [Ktedonobacteraceae bacterium]|nr:FGGY family carbohydrate kinase [Ktedonobacteraceae bacterium]
MNTRANRYVIGADVGSQGMKTVLLAADGAVIASAYAAYDPRYPAPNWAEENPADWEQALATTVRQVMQSANIHPADVAALALGSQVDGLVCVGPQDEVLLPAIIWLDRRATEQCSALEERINPTDLFHLTGANLDSSHVAPKMLWVRDNEPRVFERARYLLLPGSYMAYRLTGEAVVDYSNASSTLLLDVRQKAWSQRLLQATGIDEQRLGRVAGATEVIGPLTHQAAERLGLTEHTLVAVGSGDEHAACVGAGVTDSHIVCDINGTAEPVCAVAQTPIFDEGGLLETHCHADPAAWLIENPGFVSGGSYRWFLDAFAPHLRAEAAQRGVSPYDLLNAEATGVPAAAGGLIFLPCLSGAMTPTWNADASGVFFGLSLAHGRGHMVRAILEGTAYGLKDNVDRMAAIGLNPQEIRAVAGGARGRLWLQIKADVTGKPISVPQELETTALGAAMLAGVAGGLFADLREAASAAVEVTTYIEPDPAQRQVYDEAYSLYRDVYNALQDSFRKAAQR